MTAPDVVPETPETSGDMKKNKKKDTSVHSGNAYQRLLKAMAVIDSMPFIKDMANTQFKSIPIDQMRAAVRRACIEAGLVHVGPLDLRYEVSMRDGRMRVWTGTCIFRYVSVDDPDDYVDFPSLGEAMDTGDKGAGKLISNLVKSHYKTCFDIGERGKDDVDAYANEELEAEADRIEERRRKAAEARAKDPFFGSQKKEEDPDADLRRRIGPQMQGHADVVLRYKQEHGPVPKWSRDVLEACLRECGEGGQ